MSVSPPDDRSLTFSPYSVQSTSELENSKDGSTKINNTCPPTCHVCGIAATGYHYDVPSCNGCKTFFRRTIVSEKSFDCKREGKCFDIDSGMKPLKCRACRLNKCIDVGMNPLALQLDERETKGVVFKEIIRKRHNSSNDLPLIKVLPDTVDGKLCGVIDGLLYLEFKMEEFRSSSYNPKPMEIPRLETMLTDSSKIDAVTRMGPMEGWPLPQIPCNFSPLDGRPPPHIPERKFWMIYDMISTVEYAKTFWFMYQLDISDKIRLLRNVLLNCQNLNQAFFSVNNKCDRLFFPDGTSPPLPPLSFGHDIIRNQRKMVSSVARIDMDRQDYVLLKAICLCNAAVSGLSIYAQKILAQEKEKYTLALFKHCMTSRGAAHGPAHFSAILGIVDVLENEQRNQKGFHLLMSLTMKLQRIDIIHDVMDPFE